jgi:hypothetical protein
MVKYANLVFALTGAAARRFLESSLPPSALRELRGIGAAVLELPAPGQAARDDATPPRARLEEAESFDQPWNKYLGPML